ncbi:hypothetical protein PENSPDRAFT_749534 [Peniophora sp. CONT]|nr:hypothetical protein PENSPDRAFT_749534 [Peniophora sp. CONT]
MAPTSTTSPISSARVQPRAGITYWATAPAGYLSTFSFSASTSTASASTASTSTAAIPASTSTPVSSSVYSTVTPMASVSISPVNETTLATDPTAPVSSTHTHSSDHTAVAVGTSVSAVVALLLVVGGASYWRRRRLRRRQQTYRDYVYPRSSSEKKRAPSPPTLFVDISPTSSAYPTPFDSHSSHDRSSGSHYLSTSFSSVHRSDFFSASPSSATEPQTASTDIISSFPFPTSSMPTLPAISVTLVSPTSAELSAWATAQRLISAHDNDPENPFRTPRMSLASTRSRTVSDRPTGARPLHSRTPSLGSLSRAASPPPLHRTASVTRLHSRSASMSNLMGAATRMQSRSRSSTNLESMYMQRPGTSTSVISMDASAESSDASSPITFAAAVNAAAIHEAEEEEADEPDSPEDANSPVDPAMAARPSGSARPSPLPNVDPNDFLEPVSERRALRNRHSASLLTQASGVSVMTLPSYDAGLAAGEWHVAGGRSTPTPAYELNLDRERVVSAGGWSTAATHASCDFDSSMLARSGSWNASSLMGIFGGGHGAF